MSVRQMYNKTDSPSTDPTPPENSLSATLIVSCLTLTVCLPTSLPLEVTIALILQWLLVASAASS